MYTINYRTTIRSDMLHETMFYCLFHSPLLNTAKMAQRFGAKRQNILHYRATKYMLHVNNT